MSPGLCCRCRSPKTSTTCEQCGEPVCKSCTQFVPSDAFTYAERPASVAHVRYCEGCYAEHVEPALQEYDEILEKAKEIIFIPKTFRGPLFVLKKAIKEFSVADCPDRDETILRLAYMAARDGYNALINGDVVSQKIRNHGYQNSKWSGRALAASLDEAKLNRDAYLEEVWRRGH